MSPIGETLRTAREGKAIDLDRIADETNISKRYLMALESEDFSVFPGDPYAIGFLRNYADYLGLPADDLVASFKNMRIQEQPMPIQELIPKRGISPLGIVLIVAGVVIAFGIGLFLVFGGRNSSAAADLAFENRVPVEYRLDGSSFERRLYEGDSIIVNLGSESYKITLVRIDDAVTLETPIGKNRLLLAEEVTLDLDSNGTPEFKLLITDFAKKMPAKGAVVRIETSDPAALHSAAVAVAAPLASNGEIPSSQAPTLPPAATPVSPDPAVPATAKSTVLFEAPKSPYPFVLSVTFRGPCMFRYELDRRDRDERYYHKGETITVNANNVIKIWASNAQSAKVVIQASGGKSADVDLGSAGEVAVKRIAWSQTESGGYTLSAIDVD